MLTRGLCEGVNQTNIEKKVVTDLHALHNKWTPWTGTWNATYPQV
jgi:hypothetical protein